MTSSTIRLTILYEQIPTPRTKPCKAYSATVGASKSFATTKITKEVMNMMAPISKLGAITNLSSVVETFDFIIYTKCLIKVVARTRFDILAQNILSDILIYTEKTKNPAYRLGLIAVYPHKFNIGSNNNRIILVATTAGFVISEKLKLIFRFRRLSFILRQIFTNQE
ncbi:hypothetical protein [Dulcicalothrix desertica]|nr:hypothetical protein [Dulcicalothrix desertica]